MKASKAGVNDMLPALGMFWSKDARGPCSWLFFQEPHRLQLHDLRFAFRAGISSYLEDLLGGRLLHLELCDFEHLASRGQHGAHSGR